MRPLNKIVIGCIWIAFMGTSCKKALDLAPISSISSANFWKTESDATGALYGMYVDFRGVTATNLFLWGEARSQDIKQSIGNDYTNLPIFTNILTPVTAGPDWTSLYKVINDANLILKNVPTINFTTEANKNTILGQAYAMRAYCYFVAVRTWGGVPIVTDPTEGYNPSTMYKERSTPEEVFTQIKSDIQMALSLFADNSYPKGRNLWSKPAVYALKGDVFLWTAKMLNGGVSDFKASLDALNAVDSSDVTLLADFASIFDYTNKGNKEIIMASNYELNQSGGTFMVNLSCGKIPPNASPAAVAAIGTPGGESYWTLTDDTRRSFTDDDQRKAASFVELYTKDPTTGLYTNLYECVQEKFDGMINAGTRTFIDDVILYRYADILLLKAEAENALGMDPSDAINLVRQRAYGANFSQHIFISGSKAQNDAAILNERLLELLYEGKRWWDILRFGKAFDLIAYFKSNPNAQHELLWPLSNNILSLEPKVTQNPGY